ncbi:MAG: threonine--tRNA ligase [Planctomycetaceae bacterium]|jgi:threonyl-tRNA synthetase|nr:threonine--tRNA ligase [Planctomycetaceae bacterium]MBT4846734.1 threonine--tRNA ligase [Planctomycetaceae bacterium]MBT5123746.1 threonine--tRNA ligase [Planctomycetaceae bacterium]MBT5600493.1 threonine--tRNA ligase [Planctomycetaceae bacterium]
MLTVSLPDGSTREYSESITPGQIAAEIGPGLAKAALAAAVDDTIVGLDFVIDDGQSVALRILTKKDPEALGVMRHSAAHIMARAIMKLFPGVQLAFGPTIENGFYYDFDLEHALSEEDFAAIEAEMKTIIKANEVFERIETTRTEAIDIVEDLAQEYKVEHISEGLADHDQLSFYRQGEFIDLCRGPHIPSAGAVGAYKLLSVAGAYWKGDSSNKQLQRVYATAFFNKEDLAEHLVLIEEAKRRDHRTLGKQLNLFTISPLVGAGLILWQPKGAIIRSTLENFIRDELQNRGYQPVYTPNIGKIDLYEKSGHYPYYKDSMFAPIKMEDGNEYLLKPMNCPHHIMIYKANPRSYRELPLRLAEFGTVYRNEQSGELNGMTRVRGFTQDDAHIFCTADQVPAEFMGCIEMTQFVLKSLGLDNYRVRLGFRDPQSDKYVGSPKLWDHAEKSLIEVCQTLGIEAECEEGEAAFYGPKADFVLTDCLGREWQLGTVQLDYNLPSDERFALEYVGTDNMSHIPVMIHRAPLGSMERFIGMLIEHFAGAFPLWLAPEQVRVLIVSEKFEEYGRQVEQQLKAVGLRVGTDYRAEKIGAKIRDAQLELIPYMLILGGREMESGQVAIRDRIEGDLGAVPIVEAIAKLQTEIKDRVVRQSFSGSAGFVAKGSQNEY